MYTDLNIWEHKENVNVRVDMISLIVRVWSFGIYKIYHFSFMYMLNLRICSYIIIHRQQILNCLSDISHFSGVFVVIW